MKIERIAIITAFALAGALIGGANAAPRLCDDGTRPPCDGGGGGGGGGAPQDFGDLIILLRDANGVPILDANLCQQPIAFPSDTCTLTEATVPVDSGTCAVVPEFATCTQEVDFGRTNEARSPVEVFESQLDDVVIKLSTADCVTLDPAGRLVASTVAVDGTVSTSAIDSPLQNLAIYRQLILSGIIGAPLPEGAGILDTAARGLGAASDKSGEMNVDQVAYLNQIMGLSDPATLTTLDPKTCIDVKEEVQGVVQLVQKCFLDYGAYGYNRTLNFDALPAPPYIPADAPLDGTFEYTVLLTEDPPTFGIVYGPILDAVFPDGLGGIDPGFTEGNIGGFAQASDDTRAVIEFMHENPVQVDFVTPVPCVASDDIFYDLSISDVSGLSVPKNYVNGTERELTVNVANGGPDIANGTVTVTATADGAQVGLWVNSFEALVAGTSASFIEPFAISTASDTIIWTATVVADPPGTDPAAGNNSVTETSSVRASGGGGGH